jgi:hypothetical protein
VLLVRLCKRCLVCMIFGGKGDGLRWSGKVSFVLYYTLLFGGLWCAYGVSWMHGGGNCQYLISVL